MSKHGTVHWSELMTRDVKAAKEYYSAVCGWTFSEMLMPDGVYHIGMNGAAPTIGMIGMDGPEFEGLPPHWMTYLAVDDVDKAVRQTRDAGGEILRDAFDVPGTGRIAIIKDPTGAALGIMTPA